MALTFFFYQRTQYQKYQIQKYTDKLSPKDTNKQQIENEKNKILKWILLFLRRYPITKYKSKNLK